MGTRLACGLFIRKHHLPILVSRCVKLFLVLIAFSSIHLSVLPACGSEGEWPRWRGTHADGRWNPPGVPADFASRTPRDVWRIKIGGGFGGVTLAGGRVYVMDYSKAPEQERVLCCDAATGKQIWAQGWPVVYGKMDYGSGPRASVVIDSNGKAARAYALGATGVASCFDAVTGRIIWQHDTQKVFAAKMSMWGFAASPFIWKDKVILHVAAQPGGCLLALDKKTGAEIWRSGSDPAGYCTPELITHAGKPQLIQWGPEHIQSFDPDNGLENWKHPYEITYGVSIAQPLYANGILAVSGYWHGTKAFQLGVDGRPAKLIWEQEKEICGLMSAPLHKNGRGYILDKTKGLTCFEIATGKVLWTDDIPLTPAGRNPQCSIVWLDESRDLIALLNADGELVYAKLTASGAEEIARHQIIGKTWAHPAFTRNRIYARSDTALAAWELW